MSTIFINNPTDPRNRTCLLYMLIDCYYLTWDKSLDVASSIPFSAVVPSNFQQRCKL